MAFSSTLVQRFIPWLFVLLWSTGFIGAKYALPFIEPFYLLFIRMLLTVVVFLLLCAVFKVRWPTWRQAGHQMVVGALIHGIYLGGVFAAIKMGMPVSVSAIVVGLQPVVTALFAWMWMDNALSTRQWLGLALGFAGMVTVLLATQQTVSLSFSTLAMVAVLVSLLAICIGTLYQKRFGGDVDLLAGSVWQYFSTALLMAVLACSFESREVIWHPQLLLALAWLIFGLSVSAVLLLMLMIREGEMAKVASYFYLVPPVASVEAWLLFDEALPLVAVVGIAVTVLGVYLVTRRQTRSQTLQ